ncbi:MAG TPA: hypothetical protein VFH39_03540 [Candidatus Saccharimonadales bacterium]|nr:hypothetical protein [Candidatus Saccharimonadales bacterium]
MFIEQSKPVQEADQPVNLVKPVPVDLTKHPEPEEPMTQAAVPRLATSGPRPRPMPERIKRKRDELDDDDDFSIWKMALWAGGPVLACAIGVMGVDSVFDTHIAQDMAHIRVDTHAHGFLGDIKQEVERAVRGIGNCAVKLENGSDC